MVSNSISREDKQVLVDLVREEIDAYKIGKLVRLSTNRELGELVNSTAKLVSKYICRSDINEEDMELRRKSFYRERGNSISRAKLAGKQKPSKKELKKLYSENSSTKIAEDIGVDKSTVTYWLRQYGIPIKNSNDWTRGKNISNEHREKIRQSCIKSAPRGEQHYNYNGYSSVLPYSPVFKFVMAPYVRERDGHTCQSCDKSEGENREKISVHHIDYDKDNNDEKNLISLCRECHNPTNAVNGDRQIWIELFQEKINEIYRAISQNRHTQLLELKNYLIEQSNQECQKT